MQQTPQNLVFIDLIFLVGPLGNFPVMDVEVFLHKIEVGPGTTDAMVSACASQCVYKALKEGEPVLLEPMMKMEVNLRELL